MCRHALTGFSGLSTYTGSLFCAAWRPIGDNCIHYFVTLDSITERRVPELISVLGSQPAGDMSHKPGGRLPLYFPAVILAKVKKVKVAHTPIPSVGFRS